MSELPTLAEIEKLFASFPENAAIETTHTSYRSALKNARSWIVLDAEGGPLFMTEQYLKSRGFSRAKISAPVPAIEHDKYLQALGEVAAQEGIRFSKRADPDWRPHKFFRIGVSH